MLPYWLLLVQPRSSLLPYNISQSIGLHHIRGQFRASLPHAAIYRRSLQPLSSHSALITYDGHMDFCLVSHSPLCCVQYQPSGAVPIGALDVCCCPCAFRERMAVFRVGKNGERTCQSVDCGRRKFGVDVGAVGVLCRWCLSVCCTTYNSVVGRIASWSLLTGNSFKKRREIYDYILKILKSGKSSALYLTKLAIKLGASQSVLLRDDIVIQKLLDITQGRLDAKRKMSKGMAQVRVAQGLISFQTLLPRLPKRARTPATAHISAQ